MGTERLHRSPKRIALSSKAILGACGCALALGVGAGAGHCDCPADTIGCPGPGPYYYTSTSVIQNPPRPGCLSGIGVGDVVRLCPAGDFDTLIVSITPGKCGTFADVPIKPVEDLSSALNIVEGGATMDTTDASGEAIIRIFSAAGYGMLELCFCEASSPFAEARSPDVTKSASPTICGPSLTTSFVNGADLLNPTCGFLAKFGVVTTGVNASWDLNCDGFVNGVDIVGKGGFMTHFGHTAFVGPRTTCP